MDQATKLQQWEKLGLVFEPPGESTWIKTHAAAPIADSLDGDRHRIYFSGRDSLNRSQTGFVEIDLAHPSSIQLTSKEPVLVPGALGAFDDSGTMATWLVSLADKKYLYYIGWTLGVTVPFQNSIGLAVSHDGGRTFAHSGAPILGRDAHDPYFVASPCVMVEDGIWRMWYVSCVEWESRRSGPRHRYHIKYAESVDGIRWQRNGVVSIDFKSAEEYAISRPSVLKDNGTYKMWYSYRGESYRIGYAESKDGIQWERKDDAVNLTVSDAGWDSEMIEYPFVFDHKCKRYMLYNGNGYGKTGIGLAVLIGEK
jgi:predicted GH43/DUF377 family glycosyl hydrolase